MFKLHNSALLAAFTNSTSVGFRSWWALNTLSEHVPGAVTLRLEFDLQVILQLAPPSASAHSAVRLPPAPTSESGLSGVWADRNAA
jgi:phage gp46-like protein